MIYIDITKKLHMHNTDVVAKFTLHIKKGEFYSIFGESGAGKTTLLRIIAGLEKPDYGTIIVDNEVWFDSHKKIDLPPQKRSIGIVFQDYALFTTMSVRENLLYAINDAKRVDEILELVELKSLENRLPHTLSGGQKQRVALARALIREPKILLLDEPLSALDYTIRAKLQNELLSIHKKLSLTTILVSHDIAEVSKLSDTLAHITNGTIDKIAPPLEFFSSKKLSHKFQQTAEVLKIEYDFPIYIVTLLVGSQITQIALSKNEAKELTIGQNIVVSTKAFNLILT